MAVLHDRVRARPGEGDALHLGDAGRVAQEVGRPERIHLVEELRRANGDRVDRSHVTHDVVGLDAEKRAALHEHLGTIWTGSRPASTLLGIERLARDGMVYEVDVQAVLPE